jgi:hypothetical protein
MVCYNARMRIVSGNKLYGLLSLTLSCWCINAMTVESFAQPVAGTSPRVPEIQVETSVGFRGTWVTSFIVTAKGTRQMHGVQVYMGPKQQVRALDVYDRGVVEQQTRLHSNGATFRSLQMKWAEGDGSETIYATNGSEICRGTLRKGLRWSGTFLVKEYTSNGKAPVASAKPALMLYDFAEGRIIGKKSFDTKVLLLPEDSWLTRELAEALHDSEIVILQ